MKKLIAMIITLALTVSLYGCTVPGVTPQPTEPSGTTEASSTPETDPSSAPTIAEYQFIGPMITVSMPVVTESVIAENNGTVLYYNQIQNVSLNTYIPEVSETITLDLLNKLDALSSAKASVKDAAKADYKNQSYWYPYRTSILYEPARLDTILVSFIGTEEIFDGTPRSATVKHSVTYDLTTGEILTLKSILHDDFSADSLSELIIEGLSEYDTESFFGDYKNIIHDMFSTNVPVDSWYFTDTGLTFFFNSYEIAPHSLGCVYSEIPYEKLLGILKEEFFPAERDMYTGSLKVATADLSAGTGLEQYSRFAELNMAESSQQVVLSTDGSVTDLRIYTGSKSTNSGEFIRTAIIFSAYGIGPDDAIVIHADAALIADTLAVSYVSDGETVFVTFRLTEDGALTIE